MNVIRLPIVDFRGPQELGALERAHENRKKFAEELRQTL